MTNTDDCSWVIDVIPEFLAGRLTEAERERVRAHLASCGECRDRANAVSLLQQTPVPVPDPGRWEGFVAGVVEQTKHKKKRGIPSWLSAAAAVLVIVVVGTLYWGRANGPGPRGVNGIDSLARDVAVLPELEAAAWTAGIEPLGMAGLGESGISDEELDQLVKEVGRT